MKGQGSGTLWDMTKADIYLDHVLIAVRSLSSAADAYRSLGFKVTPEGRHPGRGTHNRLMVFGPEYLELIAVHDTSKPPFRPSMTSFLEAREGLYMFALGTSDIDTTVGEIRSRGIDVDVPVPGRRDAGETPGYTWKSANLRSALRGASASLYSTITRLTSATLCQRTRPSTRTVSPGSTTLPWRSTIRRPPLSAGRTHSEWRRLVPFQ